jgi:rhodanese-related sulfurtransferase
MFGLTFSIWNKRILGIFLERPRRGFGSVSAVALLLIGQALVNEGPGLFAGTNNDVSWDAVFAWIQHDWPQVPQMSTQELAQRTAAGNGVRPLLIDVRSRKEYDISHLPGAVWAETPDQIAATLRTAADQQPIVLYCSVGVRSSKAAATLIRSGRANVFNLKGSIFWWANEGRPLIANGHAVNVVHPYDERWGGLLNRQLHPRTPIN